MLVVLDEEVLLDGERTALTRFVDRLGALGHEAVIATLGEPRGGFPEAEFVIIEDGTAIVRRQTGETLADWPGEVPPTEGGAVGHLADSLLVPGSRVFVVTGPGRPAGDLPGNVVVIGGEPGVEAAAWLPEADDTALIEAMDQLGLFGRPGGRHGDICQEGLGFAIDTLRRNVTGSGFTAASAADNQLLDHDANYAAVWARDGVKTGLWTLCLRDEELTECFAATLRTLARHQSPSGQIPAYVRIASDLPDYSGIGGIASVDSVIWFVIGAVRYAFDQRDRQFAEEILPAVGRSMDWLTAHDSNNDGLIEIPESSDWMDLFPRSYNVLYDEVLWYQACRDMGTFLDALGHDGSGWHANADRVKARILELFWPSGTQLMELAGSASGRFSTGEGRYLLSQVTPFDYSWRCDVYANLLATLTGVLDQDKSQRLFRYLWGVGINTPLPVKCLYPAIVSGADDWKDYFLVNFLNLPGHYHNGGIWPFIGGLWVRFLVMIGRVELAHREMQVLAEACRAGIDGEWEFTEWLHAETGRPMGKAHQAWSAASYVRAYVCLHEEYEVPDFPQLDLSALQT
jgi:hypothetical protein